MTPKQRDRITAWIASHGFTVSDDGDQWHILVPFSSPQGGGYETESASTFAEVRKVLGY